MEIEDRTQDNLTASARDLMQTALESDIKFSWINTLIDSVGNAFGVCLVGGVSVGILVMIASTVAIKVTGKEIGQLEKGWLDGTLAVLGLIIFFATIVLALYTFYSTFRNRYYSYTSHKMSFRKLDDQTIKILYIELKIKEKIDYAILKLTNRLLLYMTGIVVIASAIFFKYFDALSRLLTNK